MAAVTCLLAGPSLHAAENLSFSLSLDYNSHFMSYGTNVWGAKDSFDDILFQPSVGLELALAEGSALYTGIWFDINDQAENSIGGNFQEIDVWLGYYFTVGDFVFDFAVQHWYYASDAEGVFDFTITYTGVPFSPYLKTHYRFEGNGGQKTGVIFEAGATLFETTVGRVELSFPVAIGFSPDDYHVEGKDGYGYSLIGANFVLPLNVPESYGAWDIHGGLTFYHTDKGFTGNDDSTHLALNLGVGLGF